MHPDPAQAVVLLHRRHSPPGRTLRAGEADREQLVVGDVGTDLAKGAFDPLLDLGQKLVDQHRPGHPVNTQATVTYRDVPGDGVM